MHTLSEFKGEAGSVPGVRNLSGPLQRLGKGRRTQEVSRFSEVSWHRFCSLIFGMDHILLVLYLTDISY